jgi:hypothetical protein
LSKKIIGNKEYGTSKKFSYNAQRGDLGSRNQYKRIGLPPHYNNLKCYLNSGRINNWMKKGIT